MRRLLAAVAPVLAVLVAGCGDGGDTGGAAPTTTTPQQEQRGSGLASACGIDTGQWRAGLTAAVQYDPTTGSSGSLTSPASAYAQASRMVRSSCLIGRRRPEVVKTLGGGGGDGDGRVYFLGVAPGKVDGELLRIDYVRGRARRARLVHG